MDYDIEIRGQIGGVWGVQPAAVREALAARKGVPCHVAICSPGGFIDDGMEIYQAFKDHGDVHAHIVGMTASAATVLAMGAKTVDMAKNSLILIHNASLPIFEDELADKERLDEIVRKWRRERNELKTIDDLLASVYADKSGRTVEEMRAVMKKGSWLFAEEALQLGLIDTIRKADDKQAKKMLGEYRAFYNGPAVNVEETTPKDKAMNKEKKKLTNVLQALNYDSLEDRDGYVSLSLDDLAKIEEAIASIQTQAEAALETLKAAAQEKEGETDELRKEKEELEKEKEELETTNAALHKSIDEKDAMIKAMQTAPGAQPDRTPDATDRQPVDHAANRRLFNALWR